MSKRVGETTIKTSIRIRPCSQQEKEAFPGPSPVQAAPGEVRLFQRSFAPGSGRNSPSNLNKGSSRPGTPTSPTITPRNHSSPSLMWRQQAAVQLSSEYQSYAFANVFSPEDGNEDVYNGSGCRDVVGAVLGGCNGTIFVYGQTGAGKTHTMDAVTDLVLQQLYASADDSSSEVAITVSAVELYNEILRCLLSGRENLQLRWASGAGNVNGVVLEGAEERPCGSIEEAAALVTMAKASRAVGETRANARSSRSHLIVRIKVEVLQLSSLAGASPSPTPGSRCSSPAPGKGAKGAAAGPASVTFSMLNLVDLAGSERIAKSGSADTPLRLREALNINKSLLCLGNVVTALAERAEGRRSNHIPYRDSKLTRLLEDSLGGNATTALIACITPLPEWHLEQSRNTLEFAARAARVVCKPQRNVLNLAPAGGAAGDAADLIANLQAEVAALKKQLAEQQQQQQLVSQQPQLHALSIQPVRSSNDLWESCHSPTGLLGSRGSGLLAGVAESAAEDHNSESCSGSPTSASCPTSPVGRHSGSRGWTNRLRMSLGGQSSGSYGLQDAAGTNSAEARSPKGALHSFPSRIPSPKHSLFSALASPRLTGRVSPLPADIVQQPIATSIDVAAGAGAAAPAAAAAETSNRHASQLAEAGRGNTGSLPASAHTTSILSRASGAQKSLLWKLLQQPHSQDRHPSEHPGGAMQQEDGSGIHSSSSSGHGSTQSLKSTGLLMTSSNSTAANAMGVFARWATFSGGKSSLANAASATQLDRAGTHDGSVPSHPLLASHHSAMVYTGRSSIASRRLTTDGVTCNGSTALSTRSSMLGAGNAGLESTSGANTGLGSRVAAAEAAMALRDHIIKQLVLALQQKKAEIRSLKEQLAAVLKQLESSEGEDAANQAKLRELAEGIQMLAAARQAEFEKWKGHLVGLEAALQAAQKEATNYRDESQSLVQQLTDLQGRYDNLQTEQRNSLLNVAVLQQFQQEHQQQQAQHHHQHEQQKQLLSCLQRLQDIESALRGILRANSNSVRAAHGCQSINRSRSCSPSPQQPKQQQRQRSGSLGSLSLAVPLFESEAVQGVPLLECSEEGSEGLGHGRPSSKGDVPSHRIETVSTRYFDSPSSRLTTAMATQAEESADIDAHHTLAAAAEEAAAAARITHVEFVLAELQELMPLVKAAAEAALRAATHPTGAAGAGTPDGQGHSLHPGAHVGGLEDGQQQQQQAGGLQRQPSALQTGSTADNSADKQQDQAAHTRESKVSLAGASLAAPTQKCHKCESLKPLLAIMQKLKDEVVLLKAAVRTSDSKLTAAEESSTALKADLQESRQQVGSLRERIDELSEELELARAAAAAAAAAATDQAQQAPSGAHTGACSSRDSMSGDSQQQQQQRDSRDGQLSPGGELSQREVGASRQVPLMGEDTPLEALHAQILQSWQALAMPFAYRSAFVLGPSSSNSSSVAAPITMQCSDSSSDSCAANAQAGSEAAQQAADCLVTPMPSATAGAAAAGQLAVRQAPWSDRVQCQSHIALLACLHQYHEDEPAAAEQQQEVLADESRVLQAGLANLPAGQLAQLLQRWGLTPAAAAAAAAAEGTADAAAFNEADTASQCAALMAQLWVPTGSATSAEALAADSAAACQLAFRAAPAAELAAVSLRCNASVIAAASNALADAAS